MKNIDILFNNNGNMIYQSLPEGGINQYATNYRIRTSFTKDFNLEDISYISAIIKTTKNLPERILYVKLDEKLEATIDGELQIFPTVYTYDFTFFDTQFYQDELELTVCVKLKSDTEFNSGIIYIPMNKAEHSKPTILPLDYDTTLNNVLKTSSEAILAVKLFLDKEGYAYEVTPDVLPNTVLLRDDFGRSKVNDPESDDDIANKRYVEERLTSKISMRTDISSYDTFPLIKANSNVQDWGQISIGIKGYTIPMRSNEGNISVAEPKSNEHASTKKYVDDTCKITLDSAKTYADTAVANLVDSSPEALNTLNELAASLGNDPNFATTVSEHIGLLETNKLDKITESGAGDNLYGVNNLGNQSLYKLEKSAIPSSIPLRDTGGQVYTKDPTEEEHSTNKRYVDSEISSLKNYSDNKFISNFTSGIDSKRVIGYAASSTAPVTFDIATSDTSTNVGKITMYRDLNSGNIQPSGVLITRTPIANYQAANKKYVDDKIKGATNSKIVEGYGINIDTSEDGSTHTISTNENIATVNYIDEQLHLRELYSYIMNISISSSKTGNITFLAPYINNISDATNSTEIKSVLKQFLIDSGFSTADNALHASGGFYDSSAVHPVMGIYYKPDTDTVCLLLQNSKNLGAISLDSSASVVLNYIKLL